MSKGKTPKININLSSKGKETVGKVFYKWTINAGRAIIVGIELIALLALGYRFVMDRKVVDLSDQVKQQEAFVAAQANDEKTFKSIQERLLNIKDVDTQTSTKIDIMNEILQASGNGTFLSTNLSIDNQNISLNGNTFDIGTLNDFVNKIKKSPSVDSISIDELSTTDTGINFKVTIRLKGDKKAPI